MNIFIKARCYQEEKQLTGLKHNVRNSVVVRDVSYFMFFYLIYKLFDLKNDLTFLIIRWRRCMPFDETSLTAAAAPRSSEVSLPGTACCGPVTIQHELLSGP